MREGVSLGRLMGHALEANLRYVVLATRVANSVAGAAFTAISGGGDRAVAAAGRIVHQKQLAPPLQPQRAHRRFFWKAQPAASQPPSFSSRTICRTRYQPAWRSRRY